MESFKKNILYCIMFFVFLLLSNSEAKNYKLFFLGGQSNLIGYGFVKELPKEFNITFPNVMIFEGNSTPDCANNLSKGLWANLRAGHGVGFSSDGINNYYSDRFGIELSFAAKLKELFPNDNIAIVKYARNGSSIDSLAAGEFGCWEPDFEKCNSINQYDHALATIKNSLSINDIDGDGEIDSLVPTGIIWMQGESDATAAEEVALRYSKNLKKVIDLLRAALRIDDLPVVIGRISDSGKGDLEGGKVWKYGNIVRNEQLSFVKNDPNASIVTATDNYQYSDKWHYDSNGYLNLGNEFAIEIYKLINKH